MESVSMSKIVLETKTKIERNKLFLPENIRKLKKNFLNVTGLSEDKWEIIYNFPIVKTQNDFNQLLNLLK